MKIIKKLITTVLFAILLFSYSTIAMADDTNITVEHTDYHDIALQVINDYAASIDSENWEIYRQCFDDSFQEDLKNFPSPKQVEQKTGLLTVEHMSVAMIKEISLSDALIAAPRFRELEPSKYDALYVYYVGFDTKVSHESKYYYNGVNFSLIAIGVNSDAAKIVQIESAYHFDKIHEIGISFNNEAELIAQTIVAARNYGIIINAECKVLGYLSDSFELKAIEKGLVDNGIFQPVQFLNTTAGENVYPIYDGEIEPYIRVYITSTGIVKTMPLFEYIINVLPNEWYASWHTESLKAGAMAIKTYAWNNILDPRPDAYKYHADVTDASASYQHYVENSAYIPCTLATREVQDYVMVNSQNKVFDA
ncbi:MAG: SpoIID/LytB domain-containing protein, partial [Roseburia sp.]|nr:SpoIID/LytB domain-containing protein [Roseburia sp.]